MLKKKDKLYYARIMPTTGVYDVCDLTVRTVEDTWFVGVDKHDKHAYLFPYKDIGEKVFTNINDALQKVLEAEKNKPKYEIEEDLYYD